MTISERFNRLRKSHNWNKLSRVEKEILMEIVCDLNKEDQIALNQKAYAKKYGTMQSHLSEYIQDYKECGYLTYTGKQGKVYVYQFNPEGIEA